MAQCWTGLGVAIPHLAKIRKSYRRFSDKFLMFLSSNKSFDRGGHIFWSPRPALWAENEATEVCTICHRACGPQIFNKSSVPDLLIIAPCEDNCIHFLPLTSINLDKRILFAEHRFYAQGGFPTPRLDSGLNMQVEQDKYIKCFVFLQITCTYRCTPIRPRPPVFYVLNQEIGFVVCNIWFWIWRGVLRYARRQSSTI